MSEDASKDFDSTVVVIGGKKTTVGEVQKSYAQLGFLSKTSALNVAQVLLNAKEPMTRDQIAIRAKLSVGYAIDILNELVRYEYAVQFHLGARKIIYYALTEKGYCALTNKDDKIS